ncbi:MAG: hypothetical protein PHI97_25320 [Desulfobulbus sp.]|nr:hypothetical protein [Desulfobulbus sp.]
MKNYKTDQEMFWAGSFGDEYTARNQDDIWVASNVALFSKIFAHVEHFESLIEYGANLGQNLRAIRQLLPSAKLSAVEINEIAVSELNKLVNVKVFHKSILDFVPEHEYDFVLIKGVLIHINPDFLPNVYNLLYKSTKRYICLAEYYNPSPVEVSYRGHNDKLFKRDFAGEMLERFTDLRLIDYGFVYRRDPQFPQDDITWFLLEKGLR